MNLEFSTVCSKRLVSRLTGNSDTRTIQGLFVRRCLGVAARGIVNGQPFPSIQTQKETKSQPHSEADCNASASDKKLAPGRQMPPIAKVPARQDRNHSHWYATEQNASIKNIVSATPHSNPPAMLDSLRNWFCWLE
jgi:hypothetical protein